MLVVLTLSTKSVSILLLAAKCRLISYEANLLVAFLYSFFSTPFQKILLQQPVVWA
jgi:hypothetical protein